MNLGQFVGNMVDDIKITEFENNGKTVIVGNGVLACNEKYGDNEMTSFIDFTVYNNKVKVIQDYAGKGTQLGLSGKIRTESYEDKNKVKRKKTYLYVENVDLPRKNQ
ncbi:single-stranded DNA-binding protein [Staphylococcus epidermidis]|uniref:single-stranded DNA-binding protein n=1 Tax=Staphylococcus epidermidis TaxID=1282 RepID=UPI002875E21C|nr:single-stranded DNA-binding protein [Staphylococcus epidermidis]MDS0998462.1 single-stranded DNA-binding protein [Staphylococcus epidermidis]